MKWLYLHHLPILLGFGTICLPFTMWTIAVLLDHIEPLLPCVSDLGVESPESAIFSFCINFGVCLLLFVVIIRFESIKTFIEDNTNSLNNQKEVLNKWNCRSLIDGIFMSFGFSIVANFPNSDGKFMQIVHNIGAVIGFVSAIVDMYFQSKLSFGMLRKRTGRFQCFLSVAIVILAVTYYSLSVWSYDLHSSALLHRDSRLKWNRHEKGYAVHVISNTMEWVLVISVGIYFFTFVSLFKQFSLSKRLITSKTRETNETMI